MLVRKAEYSLLGGDLFAIDEPRGRTCPLHLAVPTAGSAKVAEGAEGGAVGHAISCAEDVAER